ncbi:MAG: HigA family addiction module antitoxin [Cyanobacteria bacterium J06621_3]
MDEDKLIPISPGEVLLEEFLAPMNLTKDKVALALRIPSRHISEIIYGKRRITADTALRLARYFNMSPQFWLGLQMDYDLDVTEDAIGEQLTKEITVLTSQES